MRIKVVTMAGIHSTYEYDSLETFVDVLEEAQQLNRPGGQVFIGVDSVTQVNIAHIISLEGDNG